MLYRSRVCSEGAGNYGTSEIGSTANINDTSNEYEEVSKLKKRDL